MWFDDDEDSANADPLGNAICALAWVTIAIILSYLTCAYQAGMLPVWG